MAAWSLSTSVLKLSGIRGATSSSGTLQAAQGIPAPPQSQPCGPSQGRLRWFSQTQPVSAQKMHFIDHTRRSGSESRQLCQANASVPLEMKVKLWSNPGLPSIRSNTVSLSDGKSDWHSSILSGPIGFLRRPNSLSTARRCALFCFAELTSYPIGKGVASAVP